jgi:hypothetical protein
MAPVFRVGQLAGHVNAGLASADCCRPALGTPLTHLSFELGFETTVFVPELVPHDAAAASRGKNATIAAAPSR